MHNFYKKFQISRLLKARCCSTHFPTRHLTTKAKPSYIHKIGKRPLIYRTVGQQLERAAAEFSSKEAIVSQHEEQRRTFSSVLEEADRIAAGFHKLGLKPGDRVAIWGPNTLQWYLTMLGAARAGMISVGINPAFKAPEIEYCLKKVHVNAIVAAASYRKQNYYELLSSVCTELKHAAEGRIRSHNFPHLKAVIIDTKSKLNGILSFNEFLDYSTEAEILNIAKLQKHIKPDAACNVQFTSGTTGQPKAAQLSHFNFINNGLHVGSRCNFENERICVQVPLFHAYGVVATIMAGMSFGATLVLPAPGFNAEASLHAIANECCSVINGTPTMYVDLVKKQQELQLSLPSLKLAMTGGASCSPQLFLDIKQVLGVDCVRTIYGLTEATAVVFQSKAKDSPEQILHTVGHVHDHLEVKVVDKIGNVVPFGQPGELYVRGYSTKLGYYDDEAKTKETIGADKWLRTGDQFILQEDGYGRIVGRVKDVIIRGGENIFPKEIEDLLNTHPNVLESHVIGVPDERLGEDICAFIRLQDNVTESMTRETLAKFCNEKLAYFKVPRYVRIVKDFPKTTSGKVQKFKLKELFEKSLETKI